MAKNKTKQKEQLIHIDERDNGEAKDASTSEKLSSILVPEKCDVKIKLPPTDADWCDDRSIPISATKSGSPLEAVIRLNKKLFEGAHRYLPKEQELSLQDRISSFLTAKRFEELQQCPNTTKKMKQYMNSTEIASLMSLDDPSAPKTEKTEYNILAADIGIDPILISFLRKELEDPTTPDNRKQEIRECFTDMYDQARNIIEGRSAVKTLSESKKILEKQKAQQEYLSETWQKVLAAPKKAKDRIISEDHKQYKQYIEKRGNMNKKDIVLGKGKEKEVVGRTLVGELMDIIKEATGLKDSEVKNIYRKLNYNKLARAGHSKSETILMPRNIDVPFIEDLVKIFSSAKMPSLYELEPKENDSEKLFDEKIDQLSKLSDLFVQYTKNYSELAMCHVDPLKAYELLLLEEGVRKGEQGLKPMIEAEDNTKKIIKQIFSAKDSSQLPVISEPLMNLVDKNIQSINKDVEVERNGKKILRECFAITPPTVSTNKAIKKIMKILKE